MAQEMGKIYRDIFKPVSFKLFDIDGNEKTISQQTRMTPNISRQIEEIIEKNILSADKIIAQMVLIFGETEEFWNQIDVTLQTQILMDFTKSQKKN